MKRSPLTRTAPLKASDARLRQGPSLKPRKPLPAASPRTKADLPRRRKEKEAVFKRDRRCVLLGLLPSHRCFGDPETPHHVLKASRGGKYDILNMVQLCASANTWVEDFPLEAEALGLSKPSGPCAKSQIAYDRRNPT